MSVQVEGPSISNMMRYRSSMNSRSSMDSSHRSGMGDNSVSSTSTPGSKVISTGSYDSWFISGNYSTIGVSNQMCVQVKGSSISDMVSHRGSMDSCHRGSMDSSHRGSM